MVTENEIKETEKLYIAMKNADDRQVLEAIFTCVSSLLNETQRKELRGFLENAD